MSGLSAQWIVIPDLDIPIKLYIYSGNWQNKTKNNGTFNNSHRRGTYPNLNFWIRYMIKIDIIL